jgi:hypothetical protein
MPAARQRVELSQEIASLAANEPSRALALQDDLEVAFEGWRILRQVDQPIDVVC